MELAATYHAQSMAETPPDPAPGPPLIRALGLLAGDIWSAVTGRPRTARKVARHEVQDETRQTPAGTVKLRRTTIEEVEISRPEAP